MQEQFIIIVSPTESSSSAWSSLLSAEEAPPASPPPTDPPNILGSCRVKRSDTAASDPLMTDVAWLKYSSRRKRWPTSNPEMGDMREEYAVYNIERPVESVAEEVYDQDVDYAIGRPVVESIVESLAKELYDEVLEWGCFREQYAVHGIGRPMESPAAESVAEEGDDEEDEEDEVPDFRLSGDIWSDDSDADDEFAWYNTVYTPLESDDEVSWSSGSPLAESSFTESSTLPITPKQHGIGDQRIARTDSHSGGYQLGPPRLRGGAFEDSVVRKSKNFLRKLVHIGKSSDKDMAYMDVDGAWVRPHLSVEVSPVRKGRRHHFALLRKRFSSVSILPKRRQRQDCRQHFRRRSEGFINEVKMDHDDESSQLSSSQQSEAGESVTGNLSVSESRRNDPSSEELGDEVPVEDGQSQISQPPQLEAAEPMTSNGFGFPQSWPNFQHYEASGNAAWMREGQSRLSQPQQPEKECLTQEHAAEGDSDQDSGRNSVFDSSYLHAVIHRNIDSPSETSVEEILRASRNVSRSNSRRLLNPNASSESEGSAEEISSVSCSVGLRFLRNPKRPSESEGNIEGTTSDSHSVDKLNSRLYSFCSSCTTLVGSRAPSRTSSKEVDEDFDDVAGPSTLEQAETEVPDSTTTDDEEGNFLSRSLCETVAAGRQAQRRRGGGREPRDLAAFLSSSPVSAPQGNPHKRRRFFSPISSPSGDGGVGSSKSALCPPTPCPPGHISRSASKFWTSSSTSDYNTTADNTFFSNSTRTPNSASTAPSSRSSSGISLFQSMQPAAAAVAVKVRLFPASLVRCIDVLQGHRRLSPPSALSGGSGHAWLRAANINMHVPCRTSSLAPSPIIGENGRTATKGQVETPAAVGMHMEDVEVVLRRSPSPLDLLWQPLPIQDRPICSPQRQARPWWETGSTTV
ncbi:hypothetical protein IWZ00DRAFT_489025 [Phyllosticta capitalensis]|uniref:uncharacterized protein n=1 Tax=Phyllosticta capitalensis TaxID=121624 RepID=UPI003131488E